MEKYPIQQQTPESSVEQTMLMSDINELFHEQAETVGIWIPDSFDVPIHTMLVGRFDDSAPDIYHDSHLAIGRLNLPNNTEVVTVIIRTQEQAANVLIRIVNGVPRYGTKRELNDREIASLRRYLQTAEWDAELSARWASPVDLKTKPTDMF